MTGRRADTLDRDTIFALATGAARGAVAVMRVSGRGSARITAALCGRLPAARRSSLCKVRGQDGSLLDRALVLWMPGPASYTGEDTAELHLHGSVAVTCAVARALVDLGARPAEPGEFTRRAFLSGRMDLLEAEAIADLVAAETETQRVQALSRIDGAAGQLVQAWSDRLTRCLAYQEAAIDFPDETSAEELVQLVTGEAGGLAADVAAHLARAPASERVRSGVVVAIAGEPNVGKSSLFNALAERDAAIVSPLPGTTRDTLEVALDLRGVAVTLVDTAGLRETDDPLEVEGVRRAKLRIAAADLVLEVVQAGTPQASLAAAPEVMKVVSKTDLAAPPDGALGVSLLTGEGLDLLRSRLADRASCLTGRGETALFARARQVAALQEVLERLRAAALAAPLPELRAEELRAALGALGRLAGHVDTEAVLDVVFGAFCIGK